MLVKLTSVFWMFMVILALAGCSTISECSDAVISNIPVVNYFTGCNYCTLKIRSSKCTNNGAPFYALVKSTDFPTFLTDDYQKIANLVANPPEEEGCFQTFCIVPGKDHMVTVETPDVESIAVYFLFTTPGDIWSQILELEEGCPIIRITLEGNEIASIGK